MTQVFDESGSAHAVTILRVEPGVVTQVRSVEKDGYTAAQIASGTQKLQRMNKAQRGHFGLSSEASAKEGGAFKFVKEFRPRANRKETVDGVEKGAEVNVSVFEPGDVVAVSSISKGKGFQGVVKRYNFAGAPKTHGTKHNERAPGSIGATGAQRVFKGTRMAGRMGGERVTVKNLKVLQVNPEANLLLLRGAVPGRKGTMVEVRGM